jgi:hypothetical protein
MATQLDEKIEQLENIVEECLNRYAVTRGGFPAALAANREPTEPLEFPIEFLRRLACRELGEPLPAVRVESE